MTSPQPRARRLAGCCDVTAGARRLPACPAAGSTALRETCRSGGPGAGTATPGEPGRSGSRNTGEPGRSRDTGRARMITDVQLAIFANMLGVSLFLLVVLYHYVAVNNPKKQE